MTDLVVLRQRRKPCQCGLPKLPGSGRKYCGICNELAKANGRAYNIAHGRAWREQNRERYQKWTQEYYQRTQERQRERANDWYWANRERASTRAKRYREANPRALSVARVSKYGLTPQEYESLLETQSGGCAICGRTENGKRIRLDIDHDHETGEVRGLLCNRCNRLLSNALDSPDMLLAALAYLKAGEA